MEHRALIAELEQAVAPELEALSHFLYTHPELGMEERQAVRCLTDYLEDKGCLLYTSPSPRDFVLSRMPSSA